ncbi:MAG: iron-sulfur cluster assembly accessory protein [Gammaproteobacteria bacterium]|nr:MAG: iron-sulfur cluster assembly accessory protein [Gammaproteobacteria bacterium]
MTVETYTPTLQLTLTENAKAHIRNQMAKHPEASAFRLYVKESGCSGYMYQVALTEAPAPEDLIWEEDGVRIVVDPDSLPYVNGTHVDFVKEGLNATFRFDNPRASGACGCGESFAFDE